MVEKNKAKVVIQVEHVDSAMTLNGSYLEVSYETLEELSKSD